MNFLDIIQTIILFILLDRTIVIRDKFKIGIRSFRSTYESSGFVDVCLFKKDWKGGGFSFHRHLFTLWNFKKKLRNEV